MQYVGSELFQKLRYWSSFRCDIDKRGSNRLLEILLAITTFHAYLNSQVQMKPDYLCYNNRQTLHTIQCCVWKHCDTENLAVWKRITLMYPWGGVASISTQTHYVLNSVRTHAFRFYVAPKLLTTSACMPHKWLFKLAFYWCRNPPLIQISIIFQERWLAVASYVCYLKRKCNVFVLEDESSAVYTFLLERFVVFF